MRTSQKHLPRPQNGAGSCPVCWLWYLLVRGVRRAWSPQHFLRNLPVEIPHHSTCQWIKAFRPHWPFVLFVQPTWGTVSSHLIIINQTSSTEFTDLSTHMVQNRLCVVLLTWFMMFPAWRTRCRMAWSSSHVISSVSEVNKTSMSKETFIWHYLIGMVLAQYGSVLDYILSFIIRCG